MQRIIVTGGAGFVGSNLTLALQAKHPDAEIIVMDDFRSGHFANLRGFQGDLLSVNVADPGWERHFPKGVDAIFHLASITDTTIMDQKAMVYDNAEGFRRILDFAASDSIPVIYASSAATYGKEDAHRAMPEEQPAAPENVYAFSKVILDNLARIYAKVNPKMKIVGLRYFNVYGPRESHKGKASSMIYQLACQMKGDQAPRIFKFGEQKRDFVYVEDIVAGTMAALHARQSGIYNLGSGEARSFNDVISALNRALRLSFKPEYFDNPYPFYQNFTQADISRARGDLGYQPKFPLEEGVSHYIEHWHSIS
ncbi:MAG: ADP-glyceromanno-heptose 6-epimerase [Deltaproteobacteria bacterium]|nr:ADP-glyceromanno-heptose 6-epimerase [Deltaproteobacteria bacterium]